jgi:long-subunit fatty acid transport protein
LRGGRTRDAGEPLALDACDGAPCGYGADAAAEAIRVTGSSTGVAMGAGILVRPHPDVTLGLGFQSGVFVGLGSSNAEGEAHVRRAAAAVRNAAADGATDPAPRDAHGRAMIAYALPHAFALGAAWRAGHGWTFETHLRWTMHSLEDRIDVRLTGPELRDAPSIPDHVVLYQGLQDTFAAQLGASRQLTARLALQAAALVESPALPAEALSPRTIDGWKLDALLALRWKISRLFTAQLGYGILWVPPRTASASAFAPANMVECVESHFDVARAVCQAAEQGRGTASAAGRYSLALHRISASFAVDVW